MVYLNYNLRAYWLSSILSFIHLSLYVHYTELFVSIITKVLLA